MCVGVCVNKLICADTQQMLLSILHSCTVGDYTQLRVTSTDCTLNDFCSGVALRQQKALTNSHLLDYIYCWQPARGH